MGAKIDPQIAVDVSEYIEFFLQLVGLPFIQSVTGDRIWLAVDRDQFLPRLNSVIAYAGDTAPPDVSGDSCLTPGKHSQEAPLILHRHAEAARIDGLQVLQVLFGRHVLGQFFRGKPSNAPDADLRLRWIAEAVAEKVVFIGEPAGYDAGGRDRRGHR